MSIGKLWTILTVILLSFLFVSCVPGYYTSCSTWEIFSNQYKSTKRFKLRVCDSTLGYGFNNLVRKDKNIIRKEVYPKLVSLMKTQHVLKGCRIDPKGINYLYGGSRHRIEALIVCRDKITFEKEDGRYYTAF